MSIRPIKRLSEARYVLEGSRKDGLTRELWHRAEFRAAHLECEDPEEISKRFDRYLGFDRGNIDTYLHRVEQLLPRWGHTRRGVSGDH